MSTQKRSSYHRCRPHLRNESPLVAGGLEVVEPSHLALLRYLGHEILCARLAVWTHDRAGCGREEGGGI